MLSKQTEPPLKIVTIGIEAAFGIVAAVLWFCAASVKVPFAWPKRGEINDGIAMFTGEYGDKSKTIDVLMTAQKQTRWNKLAAAAAAIAAVCQALSLFL